MSDISTGRVVLGGLVAGIVSDAIGFAVDGKWLAPSWNAGMKALGHGNFAPNQMIGFNLLGLAGGLVAVWIYAAIRPRFGPGLMTAIKAGGVVWFLGTLLPNLGFMYLTGLFPHRLTINTTVGGLAEVVLGTIAGAIVYREAPGATERHLARMAESASV